MAEKDIDQTKGTSTPPHIPERPPLSTGGGNGEKVTAGVTTCQTPRRMTLSRPRKVSRNARRSAFNLSTQLVYSSRRPRAA